MEEYFKDKHLHPYKHEFSIFLIKITLKVNDYTMATTETVNDTKDINSSRQDPKDPHSLMVEEDGTLKYPKGSSLSLGFFDKLRPTIYMIDALTAETKFILRKMRRELNNLFRLLDLTVIFALLIGGLVLLFVTTTFVIPGIISLAPESVVGNPSDTIWGPVICKVYESNGTVTYSSANCARPLSEATPAWPFSSRYTINDKPEFTGLSTWIFHLWTGDTTIRLLAGTAGVIGVILQLLFKSEIDKYRDKIKGRSDVTYVFGSSVYAEKFLTQLVFTFAYEDEATLISDAQYLWVERIAGLLDTYVVKDEKEFEKSNLYTILEFKNAKRIYILTDNVMRNQNILTNIRAIRPDVPIYILSQFTPDYLKDQSLVKDENLHIIDDLETTREGLVKSLSLDIKFPLCSEVNVPKRYVGKSALLMNNDLGGNGNGIEILAVRRAHLDDNGWDLIPPEKATLMRTDRLVLHVTWDFKMKEANRIVTETPVRYLADLGELKYEKTPNKFVKASITDLPGKKLLIEPKGTRKSWKRRIVGLVSIILLIAGLVLGKFSKNLPFNLKNSSLDLVLIILAIIGFIIYQMMNPILLKGIVEIDKHEKALLRRKKSFTRFGKDQIYDFSKMKSLLLVNVEGKNSKRQFRNYYLLDENNNKHLFIRILWNKKEKKQDKILSLKRFENRLQEYTGFTLTESFEESDEPVNVIDEDEDSDFDVSETNVDDKKDLNSNNSSAPTGGL